MKEDKSSPGPPGPSKKKRLLTLLLLLHFFVILFNNLPHTALTYRLDDLYLGYLNFTGQYQIGWGMYLDPNPANERFVITVYDTNDPDKSYSHHNITDSRELYLAEVIKLSPASVQTNLAQSYLLYVKKNMNLSAHHQVVLNCYTYSTDPESGMRNQALTSWKLDSERP